MFSEETIRLVREDFEAIRPLGVEAINLFYQRLFEIAPHTRSLFADDMSIQMNKLLDMLTLGVASLDMFDQIEDSLADLGTLHAEKGVSLDQYPVVAHALIDTLRAARGDAFTGANEAAWREVLDVIAAAMMTGAMRQDGSNAA